MRYNQYAYIQTPIETMLHELTQLGFELNPNLSDKENLERFVRKTFFHYQDTDYPLSMLLADTKSDLLQFFQSDQALTDDIFFTVALQLLGFVPGIDYEDLDIFLQEILFPITATNIIERLYHLLNCRQKSGNTLIDHLVAQGLIPQNNTYHFFNGKLLATFSSHDLIKEVVYVETGLDTDQDGQIDLVKVNIIRPRYSGQIPCMLTNSPYQQGVNEIASDKALYNMVGELAVKAPKQISLDQPKQVELLKGTTPAEQTYEAEESFTYHGRLTTLNDYFLPRGFANLYVSGIGTLGSDGLITSGDYRHIQSYKAVIDWLNGRAIAFTSHRRDKQVLASWANGKVATTGISYLGTLSTGLATTGVDGLEVIIAEAGISSWYDYYRENGLVVSPGGYPGEDLDSLAALTYSKSLQAGDYLKTKNNYQTFMAEMAKSLDRTSADMNAFWQDRNYLPQADQIKAEVVYTHGLQDWNVKPIHVYNIFKRLAKKHPKHLFLHLGEHVYMNNWQSIDFRESINALLSKKLLNYDNGYQLPEIIWQDNSLSQTWQTLQSFGSEHYESIQLGDSVKTITNAYPEETFDRYSKDFNSFKQDLFTDKANQITLDIPLDKNTWINGRISLKLLAKSSINKGLLSAQILDFGPAKRITSIPMPLIARSMDNGRCFTQEDLRELPMSETPYRVLTKGHINLQNRKGLLEIEEVPEDTWLEIELDLQPTIYKLSQGSSLRLIIYTTDFEHTIRDNGDWKISIDLSQSSLQLPLETHGPF